MANPFFDQNRYLWQRPEAVALHVVLYQTFRESARVDLLYRQSGGGLPPLPLAEPPDLLWKAALENLAAAGALRMFCEIVSRQPAPSVQEAAQALFSAEASVTSRTLVDDLPVLDRGTLRERLTLLESHATPVKVLLIRGGPQSGKSYSFHLFRSIAMHWGAEAVYLGEGMVGSVDDVVLRLFSVLQASKEIPPGNSTDEAWYTTVFNRLLEIAKGKQQPLWIAVDDLGPGPDGAPLLVEEIRHFCEKFALQLRDPSFHRWFRLMLIHYPEGAVPTRWKTDIWREDRTSEDDITDDCVVALLREWSAQRQPELLEAEMRSLAAEVIAKADTPLPEPDAPPRLQRINDALVEALQKLGRVT